MMCQEDKVYTHGADSWVLRVIFYFFGPILGIASMKTVFLLLNKIEFTFWDIFKP